MTAVTGATNRLKSALFSERQLGECALFSAERGKDYPVTKREVEVQW